jgi:ABC-type nitrate/sulfonate/bicarbonate transport system substrate-binding protein
MTRTTKSLARKSLAPKSLATALVAVLIGAAACGGGSSSTKNTGDAGKTKVSLTLNWVPYGEHAPFYYGARKGIFAAQGIDLDIRSGTGSGNTIQQVAQQKTDFGWADTPPLAKGVSAGMKVKSVGVFLQKGPSSIEYLSDKNISRPSDLKGKTIGGTPGDALYALFPAWLKANGLAKDDVKVVDLDAASKISALAEGTVDAIMGFFHDQGPTIENKTGKKVSYLLYSDWGMNLLGTGLVVNEDTMKNKKDLVRRMVKATQQSWAAAARDIPGAVDSMVGVAEQAPPKEVMVKQLRLAVGLLGDAANPGVDDAAKWTETINLMARYGGLQQANPPDTYWDPSFATKV